MSVFATGMKWQAGLWDGLAETQGLGLCTPKPEYPGRVHFLFLSACNFRLLGR